MRDISKNVFVVLKTPEEALADELAAEDAEDKAKAEAERERLTKWRGKHPHRKGKPLLLG